jgi:hypothetical protein
MLPYSLQHLASPPNNPRSSSIHHNSPRSLPVTLSHPQSPPLTPNHTTCICLLPSTATSSHAYIHIHIHIHTTYQQTPSTTTTPSHSNTPNTPNNPPITLPCPRLPSVPVRSRPYEPAARHSALQLSAMHCNPNRNSPPLPGGAESTSSLSLHQPNLSNLTHLAHLASVTGYKYERQCTVCISPCYCTIPSRVICPREGETRARVYLYQTKSPTHTPSPLSSSSDYPYPTHSLTHPS